MADRTAAERQRRYRERQAAHKAGDHSKCDPSRCDPTDVTRVTVTQPVTRDGGTRGGRLWREMGGDDLTGGERALLEEACRIADRLDKLDRLLCGDVVDWLGIVEDKGNPERQIIVIDRPLAEARQQATALKQIVAELRQAMAPKSAGRRPAAPAAPKTSGGEGVPSGVADLTSRIAERRAQAQG